MLIPSLDLRPGLTLSLAIHALALGLANMLVQPTVMPDREPDIIEVEVVTLPPAAPSRPALSVIAVPETAPVYGEAAGSVDTDLIEATEMLAAAALADPRNAGARAMLGKLDTYTRREQLCGIEALEQLRLRHADWLPEFVVANAFVDTVTENDVVTASGAAVKTGESWRHLSFVCTLASDLASVTAFSFRIGDVIPENERVAHDLVFNAHE